MSPSTCLVTLLPSIQRRRLRATRAFCFGSWFCGFGRKSSSARTVRDRCSRISAALGVRLAAPKAFDSAAYQGQIHSKEGAIAFTRESISQAPDRFGCALGRRSGRVGRVLSVSACAVFIQRRSCHFRHRCGEDRSC